MNPLPPWSGFLCRFVFYFSVLAAALSGAAFLGFTGDESGYVAPNTAEFATHIWLPYLDKVDTGHPMLYAWFTGVFWRLFGMSNVIANVMIWLYGALALCAIHGLAAALLRGPNGSPAPRWAGPGAALCLLATPLFIAHCAQYLDAVPFTAFLLLMVLAWVSGRRFQLGFWATLLAMTRITGWLGVLGLGLYDLALFWRDGSRRRFADAARHMLPYIIPGVIFILFFAIKLWVLKRPLNNFKKNDFSFNNLGKTWDYVRFIGRISFSFPRYSFSLLFLPAAFALLVSLLRKRGTGGSPVMNSDMQTTQATPNHGRAARATTPIAIYGALAAAILPWCMFYCVYWMSPNPRWFISVQAALILVGVHGLAVLLGRRRALAVPLMVAWCVLVGLRWHDAWVTQNPCLGQSLSKRLRYNQQADYSLDVLGRKRMVQDAVDWVVAHTKNPVVMSGYATTTAFVYPSAGYTNVTFRKKIRDFSWISKDNLDSALATLDRNSPEMALVISNYDKSAKYPEVWKKLLATRKYRLVLEEQYDSGEWIKVYYDRR